MVASEFWWQGQLKLCSHEWNVDYQNHNRDGQVSINYIWFYPCETIEIVREHDGKCVNDCLGLDCRIAIAMGIWVLMIIVLIRVKFGLSELQSRCANEFWQYALQPEWIHKNYSLTRWQMIVLGWIIGTLITTDSWVTTTVTTRAKIYKIFFHMVIYHCF